MKISQMIHAKWSELTDNGQADDRVFTAERLVEDLKTKLRARYNINIGTQQLLDAVRESVSDQLKTDIVTQWNMRRASAERAD